MAQENPLTSSTAPGSRAAPSAPHDPAWAVEPLRAGGDARVDATAGTDAQRPALLSSPLSSMPPNAQADLAAEFRTALDAGVHGLCFSPYLEGQAPGAQVSETQIRARLELIRAHTRWIRSFSDRKSVV